MAARRSLSLTTRLGVCGAVTATMLLAGGLPAHAATSPNLLKNGTAEAAPGGTGGVVPVPGWKRSTGTKFTAVKYGTPGFPSTSSPAPHNRGKNFFAGGPFESGFNDQVATQTISLASYVNQIKAGKVTATAAGWFGGQGSEHDMAGMEINFKSGNGSLISAFQVGFVTAAQRHNVTGLLHRIVTKGVPKGARSVLVELICERIDVGGPDTTNVYNNGYADNVTLTLAGV